MRLSEKEVLKIANKEVINLGYEITDMKISIDDNNSTWNDYNKNNIVLRNNPELKRKLQDKEYFAVYYAPKELQFGGDLWIFIEKETGEIITFIIGE